MKYKLYSEDGVTKIIEAADIDAAKDRAEAWMRQGEWGTDGAHVTCTVTPMHPPYIVPDPDGSGDLRVDTDEGWGYITHDGDTGLASAYWQARGAKALADIAVDVAPLAALAALIAAVPADALAETQPDGEEIEVEIEPDHDGKIKEAARHADICGTDPDDHDWTSDGEGGSTENPGVWSHGGTTMSFASHCRKCGLHRLEKTPGSQRNPGGHDTVEYEMLDAETIARHRANGDMDEAPVEA